MFNCCKRKRNHFENIPDDVIINILDYLDSPRKITIEFDDNSKVSWWSIREKSLINTVQPADRLDPLLLLADSS